MTDNTDAVIVSQAARDAAADLQATLASQSAELDALRAERDAMRNGTYSVEMRRRALAAEARTIAAEKALGEARELLAPFAKAADDIEQEYGERPIHQYQFPPLMMLHFSRARTFLANLTAGGVA